MTCIIGGGIFFFVWTLTYICVIGYCRWQFERCAPHRYPPDLKPATAFSIVIPARNEAASLPATLQAILTQHYPIDLFEIIVIDDHSTDATYAIAQQSLGMRGQVLRLQDFPLPPDTVAFKKMALEIGIAHAQHDWILTTDADTLAAPTWLAYIAAAIQQAPTTVAWAAPVLYKADAAMWQAFQALDNLGMMGVTAAGIQAQRFYLANGANFAFAKAAYTSVNGYAGITDIASGDDMLLLQKLVARYGGNAIGYVKTPAAAVFTNGQPTLCTFWQQRVRWASKSGRYRQPYMLLNMVIIYGMSVWLLSCVILGFWQPLWWGVGAALWLLKTLTDYVWLRHLAHFFGQPALLHYVLPAQLLHVGYIAAVGTWANLFKRYQWKGRAVR